MFYFMLFDLGWLCAVLVGVVCYFVNVFCVCPPCALFEMCDDMCLCVLCVCLFCFCLFKVC